MQWGGTLRYPYNYMIANILLLMHQSVTFVVQKAAIKKPRDENHNVFSVVVNYIFIDHTVIGQSSYVILLLCVCILIVMYVLFCVLFHCVVLCIVCV